MATAPVTSIGSPTSERPSPRRPPARRPGALALAVVLAAATLAPAGSAPAAQTAYPIFTFEDFVKMMKSVGANWGGTVASVAKGDFEEAKSRLTRSREQLAVTVTFWRDRKRDDAVRMLRTALSRLDDLDAALSAEAIDPAAAAGRAGQVDAACEACHAVYRDQDPVTKAYRLKPGSVP